MSKLTLLDEARAIASAKPGPLCDVRKALLDHPALADEIADVLRDHLISAAIVEDVLDAREVNVKAYTIRRHRQNRCTGCKAAGVTW